MKRKSPKTSGRSKFVFLFDVDNTLLDNDQVIADLAKHLKREVGPQRARCYWALFEKPVIFAFHAYPWLIHRLTYRRTNHGNIHVRGYKEEGTITTPFDMTVLNDLDRFHLVMDTIDRLPQTGERGVGLKQQLKDKLIEHRHYIGQHGEDLPEIRNWRWVKPK